MNGFLKVSSSLLFAGTLLVSFLWLYSGHPQFFGFPPQVDHVEAAQFARPDSDVSIGSWTGSPVNTAGNRYQNIDETSASDSDFVRSQNDPSNSAAEFGLSNVTDPLLSTGHIVRYRYRKGETGGGQPGTINITVELRQGTTVIASQTHNGAGTSFADGNFTLTSGQADGITDYTDLRLRFSANKSAGARTSWGEISWAELETPDVAVPDLSWDDIISIPGYTFSIYQSSSLTFGSGTLICQAELFDDNASTVDCLSGSLAPGTQYRVEATLFNNGDAAANMASGDFVDNVAVKGGWAGTTPTLGSCAFADDFGDDISPSCSVSFNGNDVRITNTSGNVAIGPTEYERFAYLITTDSDVPSTNSASYMNASIDSVTEDSSKITISGPSGNSAPTVSSVEVNNSTAITLNEGTSKTVTVITTVTDADGCSDISSVVADFYMQTAVGATACDSAGEANDNQCYPRVTCSVVGGTCGGGGDTSADYTCNFNVWYVARPTDVGSPDAGDTWEAKVTVDDGEATGTGTDTEEINTLQALNVTSSINYGNLDPNTDTGSSNATTTVSNTGNAAIDVEVSGTAMTFSSFSIAVSNQKYDVSSVAYSSLSFTLSGTPTQRELDLAKPTATSTPVTDDLFWGLFVPLSTPSGTYNGTNTFTAVGD